VCGIFVNDATDIVVSDISYGAGDITFTLTNNNAAEVTVQVVVTGRVLELPTTDVLKENTELSALFDKELEIDNHLLQDDDVIDAYIDNVLSYVSDPAGGVELEIRGDPSIELGDVIDIDDDTDGLGQIQVFMVRNALYWGGSMSSNVSSRKVVT
jgi:hypothetical protein